MLVFRMKWVVMLCVFLLLNGCVSVMKTAPVDKKMSAAEQQGIAVNRLLSQAERALQADRLMSPASDNAYDRFQAVLLMQPKHPSAISGLQVIVLRYIELARDALARQRRGDVAHYLARAEVVGLGRELIDELKAQRDQHLSRGSQVAAQGLLEGGESRLMLTPDILSARGEPLHRQLQAVAERIEKTHESLLIVARTDGEGRWLYKQIKSRLVGYRLRGDIRIGEGAYLAFLPPLD
jgi:hypothetical protein